MEKKAGFFVKRPIFATVISLIILLVGFLSIRVLPVEQYPDLTPPTVQVSAIYTGASADTISENVAAVLERKIVGVENMIYMTSTSTATEGVGINIVFSVGTDPDQATINVNNRVQTALSQLPQEVQRMGVTVIKSSPSILAIIVLTSSNPTYDALTLSNYATLNILDELKIVKGVGNAINFAGQTYAMRVWLDTKKMANYNITAEDISNAIMVQNAQFAAGRIGEPPQPNSVEVTWQVITSGRLNTPEALGNVILKTESSGALLRLKDVARVELSSEDAHYRTNFNRAIAVPLGVFLSPGANALDTANGVKALMEKLSESFPDGVEYSIPVDTSKFVKTSITNVIKTLIEAMILVFIVVFVFLQRFRATLIPALAVPVSIVGTFAGMYVLGFSVNTLTMFGLVLAIGIVVDDAIVVLENVERHLSKGLSSFQATAISMREVTRPIIAIVLVLSSVFIPIAFLGGFAGQMYKQFAITIVVSVIISGIVALTLTPALCVLLLKHKDTEPALPFRIFNSLFEKATNQYIHVVEFLMRHVVLTLTLFVAIIFATAYLYAKLPSGLIPMEDQGRAMGIVMLPDGASMPRSAEVMKHVDDYLLALPYVESVMSFSGYDVFGGAMKTNYGSFFVNLKDWSERKNGETPDKLVTLLQTELARDIPEAQLIAFNPPPIDGLGSSGGFEMWLQNRSGDSYERMYEVVRMFEAAAAKRPEITGISTTFAVSAPQLVVTVDRDKVASMGVDISKLFLTMQTSFSSYYVNDFNLFGRTFKIFLQAENSDRALPDDISKLLVRNEKGEMIPISSFITIEKRGGSQVIDRFNNFPASQFTGDASDGYTAGEAMTALEEVASEVLPQGYTIAWSGTSYQQKVSSTGTLFVFALALIMVFLVLAAQYESWSLPMAVLFAAPFALFGASLANTIVGYSNDIYFQVAIVTLIGLSAKNAILIIEFAIERYLKGDISIDDAALEGTKLRFRPIIMTSFAFIAGCVPLAISSGAGAASRSAIGVSVIGGMLMSTMVAPLFVPFFFKIIMSVSEMFFGRKNNLEDNEE